MKLLGFFYILTGIGAFFISATIEYYFFKSITQDADFSFYIVGIFETAKVLTILITRFIIIRDSKIIMAPLVFLGWSVKILLVTISLISSIGFLSSGLDRPHLQSVKENDRGRTNKLYSEKFENMKEQQESTLNKSTSEIKERYKRRYEKLSNYYEPKIDKEERLRDFEFSRKINGIRRGERYHEHQRKLMELSNKYKLEKDQLLSDENQEVRSFIAKTNAGYQRRFDKLEDYREKQLNQIEQNSYSGDQRVSNGPVAALLSAIKAGLNIEMKYLTFSLFFSLLVSFTLEGLIYLIFNNIAIFYSTINENNQTEGAEDAESLKEFLNKNIHDAAEFISKKAGEKGVNDGPY